MRRRPEIMAEVCQLFKKNNNAWYTLTLAGLCFDVDCRAYQAEHGKFRRSDRRFTVEESRALPADGWDERPRSGTWSWPSGGNIGYQFDPARLTLRVNYTVTGQDETQAVDYTVQMAVGRSRWRFFCPLTINGVPCQRPVAQLYLPPTGRYFGCRNCYGLTYASRQSSR